jgi:putative DNA primase/helicase
VQLPDHPGIEASRVRWGERIEGTARELLAQAEVSETQEDRDERQSVAEFLRAELEDGQAHNTGDLLRAGESLGFSRRSIQRAADRLHVIKEHAKELAGGWTWTLSKMPQPAEGAEGDSVLRLASSSSSGPQVTPSDDVEAF